jgi:fatty acid desaturase
VHHRHVGEACDWVQPRTRPDGRYESIYRYVLCHWPWRYALHLWRDIAAERGRVRRRALLESLMFLPFWLAPIALDPVLGIGLWLYPHWFGSAFILGTGMYTQHAGGTAARKHSGSTTFLSEFFNLTMFNVGYHTEHHANPAIHWSELPALHERLRDELIEEGAHIVPYGSYGASRILSGVSDPEEGMAIFRRQHPDYVAEGAHA